MRPVEPGSHLTPQPGGLGEAQVVFHQCVGNAFSARFQFVGGLVVPAGTCGASGLIVLGLIALLTEQAGSVGVRHLLDEFEQPGVVE